MPRLDSQRGFAILVLMAVIAAIAGVFAAMVGSLFGLQRNHGATNATNLGRIRLAAEYSFATTGSFPGTLTALASTAGLDPQQSWRRDPYGPATDYTYALAGTPAVLTVTSRGPDRLLGTADDVSFRLSSRDSGRVRARDRIRLIRARLLTSTYRTWAGMSLADRANLRSLSRQYALARRAYIYANAATQATLAAQMATALASIQTLCMACPPLPGSVTGALGLMQSLGLPDAMATDGFGRTLVLNQAVGVISVGGDGAGGTADDM